jgi:hypothetical protein
MDGGVLPGEREVHHSSRDLEVVWRWELLERTVDGGEEAISRETAPVKVDLERANARSEVDHPIVTFRFEPGLQSVHSEALFQIEEVGTELDQKVSVSRRADHHLCGTSHFRPK